MPVYEDVWTRASSLTSSHRHRKIEGTDRRSRPWAGLAVVSPAAPCCSLLHAFERSRARCEQGCCKSQRVTGLPRAHHSLIGDLSQRLPRSVPSGHPRSPCSPCSPFENRRDQRHPWPQTMCDQRLRRDEPTASTVSTQPKKQLAKRAGSGTLEGPPKLWGPRPQIQTLLCPPRPSTLL